MGEHELERRIASSASTIQEYTDEMLDAIDDVFYVLDGDGCFRRWNESR